MRSLILNSLSGVRLIWLFNLQGEWKGKKIVFDQNYSPSSSVACEIYRVHVWLGVVCAMNVVFLSFFYFSSSSILCSSERGVQLEYSWTVTFYIFSQHWPKNTSLSHRFFFLFLSHLLRSLLDFMFEKQNKNWKFTLKFVSQIVYMKNKNYKQNVMGNCSAYFLLFTQMNC